MRCESCARDAGADRDSGSARFCCSGCERANPIGVHTAACNQATFPDWEGAQYLDELNAPVLIVERLQKALILAHMLNKEFHHISDAAQRFIPGYTNGALDMSIHHLQIDIRFCEGEARRILGS